MVKYHRARNSNKGRFNWNKWANRISTGAQVAGNVARSYAGYQKASRVTSGQGVTIQRDRAVIYRRKRAPRKKRMRARRSMRSFKSKILKLKGHRTLLTNAQFSSSSALGAQSVTSWVLYGGRVDGAAASAAQRGYDDMNDMRKRDYMLGDSTGDLQQRFAPGDVKWYVKTAVMDITIQNGSATVGFEMDIYEFTCGEIPSIAGSDVETAIQFYNQDTYLPGASSAGLQILTQDDRGATPFEFGPAMSKIRMKILKKTKYFVPGGDTVTYQIRDSKIRTMNHGVFRNNSCTTRYTRGVYVVCKPTPANAESTTNYICGCTRKYKYVIDSSAVSRTGQWDPANT